MKKLASKLSLRRRQGQGMTEYIMIVALVAILMIPAVSRLKFALVNSYEASTDRITRDVTEQLGSGY